MRLPFSVSGALTLGTLLTAPSLGAQASEKRPTYQRDRILFDEIDAKASDAKNAYEVIERLRPQFLRSRPSRTIQNQAGVPIHVFIDGGYRGGLEVLREITAVSVIEITYLNGSDATTRFGTGYESGAILVKTGKRQQN
jgi:hypothetical protein